MMGMALLCNWLEICARPPLFDILVHSDRDRGVCCGSSVHHGAMALSVVVQIDALHHGYKESYCVFSKLQTVWEEKQAATGTVRESGIQPTCQRQPNILTVFTTIQCEDNKSQRSLDCRGKIFLLVHRVLHHGWQASGKHRPTYRNN